MGLPAALCCGAALLRSRGGWAGLRAGFSGPLVLETNSGPPPPCAGGAGIGADLIQNNCNFDHRPLCRKRRSRRRGGRRRPPSSVPRRRRLLHGWRLRLRRGALQRRPSGGWGARHASGVCAYGGGRLLGCAGDARKAGRACVPRALLEPLRLDLPAACLLACPSIPSPPHKPPTPTQLPQRR